MKNWGLVSKGYGLMSYFSPVELCHLKPSLEEPDPSPSGGRHLVFSDPSVFCRHFAFIPSGSSVLFFFFRYPTRFIKMSEHISLSFSELLFSLTRYRLHLLYCP